ncbi:MAG: FecR family protein [Gemmatimonadales bacterium]
MSDQTPSPEVPSGQPDWEALARQLTGEGSAEERAALSRQMAAKPGSAELVAALSAALERVAFRTPGDLDVEGALRRVRERMDEPVVLPLAAGTWGGSRARRVAGWRGAALGVAAVLVASVGITLWRQGRGAGNVTSAVSPVRVVATGVGKRDSTQLPDGSRVLLGPGSRLTIAAGFAQGHREVELVGDAFFDVKHDADHPFAVRVLGGVISDVGTTFTVHADRGDGVVVSVTSGAVELRGSASGADRGAVLRAGDLGVVDGAGAVTSQQGGATPDDTAWMTGRLVFRDAPLAKVRADLRRWYGVELVTTDSTLVRRHVTASFNNDSQRQVLKVITLALGASYEVRGDTVLLRSSASPAVRPRR